jgi:hypothetical protein
MSKRKRRGRRRFGRNPALAIPSRELVITAGWAIAGGVGARSIPELLLKEGNRGVMGYVANAVAAAVLSWAGGRFISPNAGKGLLIGGAVGLGGRLVEDFFGKKLVEFTAIGMGSDPGYNLGAYDAVNFPLPYSPAALPSPAAVAAAAANANAGFSGF